MKVLTGHLTATNKKVIKAMLDQKLTEGCVRKVNYYISVSNGTYTVKIQKMDKGLIPVTGSALRLSTYISTFTA